MTLGKKSMSLQHKPLSYATCLCNMSYRQITMQHRYCHMSHFSMQHNAMSYCAMSYATCALFNVTTTVVICHICNCTGKPKQKLFAPKRHHLPDRNTSSRDFCIASNSEHISRLWPGSQQCSPWWCTRQGSTFVGNPRAKAQKHKTNSFA